MANTHPTSLKAFDLPAAKKGRQIPHGKVWKDEMNGAEEYICINVYIYMCNTQMVEAINHTHIP